MRNLIKNIFMLSALAILFNACTDSVENKEAYMEEGIIQSFGFYVDDNEGNVEEDIVVEITKSKEFRIVVPRYVNKTNLIARITTDNDKSIIKIESIDGEDLISGKTAIDYTNPVDLWVITGDNIIHYTITLVNGSDMKITRLEPFTDEEVSAYYTMKINPVTGVPYVLFRKKTKPVRAAMIKYENDQWSYVGSSEGFSEGGIGVNMDIAFNSKGQVYVAYTDDTGAKKQSATVQYFDGSDWVLLGKDVTSDKVSVTALALTSRDEVILANNFDGRNGPLARREVVVSTYSGSSWTTDVPIPGRSSEKGGQQIVGKTHNDVTYWAAINYTASKPPTTYALYSYKDGTWNTLADNMIEPSATTTHLGDFDMDVDSKGNIYLAVADDAADASIFRPRVKKYNIRKNSWSNIASPINVNLQTTGKFSLAISLTDIPYMLYRDVSGFPLLVSLDYETGQWTEPLVLDSYKVSDLVLDFDRNSEKGYILYGDPQGHLVLHECK